MASKRRNYRRRNEDYEEEDNQSESTSVKEKLEEIKELQKFRSRPRGVTPSGLAYGMKDEDSLKVASDPYKLRTGGLLDINTVKDRERDRSGEGSDKDVTSLGNSFSQETNRRDEDVEMLRFIDKELARRSGKDEIKQEDRKAAKSEEDLLYEVPDQINIKSKVMKSEEMLSNQMLSGIPEIDLGIQAKIINIEATEEAKGKLLNEMRNKKNTASDFVPTNLASNFLLHERFYNEQKAVETEKQKEKAKKEEEQRNIEKFKGPTVEGTANVCSNDTPLAKTSQRKRKAGDEASDDYLYDKFKRKTSDSWRYQ